MKNTLTDPNENQIVYNDLYARLLITLFGAHYIVSFGEPESFFELVLMWDFIRSLLYSWSIAFILITLIRWITLKLDKRFNWQERTIVRLLLQSLFGIAALSLVAFLLAALYFDWHNINILNTEYLTFDFPLILLMLTLINVYYFVYYVFVSWRQSKNTESSKNHKNVFIIQQAAKNIPIRVQDISYFYRSNDANFIRTIDGNNHIINETLDQVEQSLDPVQFFRTNRQFIIAFSACERFEIIENDKLELFVKPPYKERIIISQKKAPLFRNWLVR